MILLLIILTSIWILVACASLHSKVVDDIPSFIYLVTPFNIISFLLMIGINLKDRFDRMKYKKNKKKRKKLIQELNVKMKDVDPYGEEDWTN